MTSVTNRSTERSAQTPYIDERPEYRFVRRQPQATGRRGPALRLPDRTPPWIRTAFFSMLLAGTALFLVLALSNSRDNNVSTTATDVPTQSTTNADGAGTAASAEADAAAAEPATQSPGPSRSSDDRPPTVSAAVVPAEGAAAIQNSDAPAAAGWTIVERYDFGPLGSPVQPGYIGVTPLTDGAVSFSGGPISAGNRPDGQSAGGSLNQDTIFSSGIRNFTRALDNGVYRLQITMGDPANGHDDMAVSVEGIVAASGVDTEAGEFTTVVHLVTVRDGELTVTFTDRGGADDDWAVTALTIEARG